MLLLPLKLDSDRYAIAARQVVEVVPCVPLRRVPHAPAFVAGLLNYRGRIVPVLDVRQLVLGSPCARVLSTRIVLVARGGTGEAGDERLIGLMAEDVTEAIERPESAFADPGLHLEQARYLGGIGADDRGLLQLLRIEPLLDEPAVRELLDAEHGEPGA